MSNHPISRFTAPSSIQTGVPLKSLIDSQLVELIGESIHQVDPNFDLTKFTKLGQVGLGDLEFKARAAHIADAMASCLPDDTERSLEIIIDSLGPKLEATQDYGLQPFFYLAHAEWIARAAEGHFETGMRANYELTQRFTAEFSIRPYIVAHRDSSLALLDKWCEDPNPHVRRLVSEGTRSRLPWAMRLKEIDKKPTLTLPLLEQLKDDDELYVRRSVANHLGDIGKENLPILLETCGRWLEEVGQMKDPDQAKQRKWIIRHALRHPAKKENPDALKLRKAGA